MCTSNKCIAVREIVAGWMKQNGVNSHWTVDDNLTTDRYVMISVVGVADPLILPNDEHISSALKREVEEWLTRIVCKD